MTFWLEKEWQERAARSVCSTLDRVNQELLPQNLYSGAWTKPMLAAIASTAIDLCTPFEAPAACSFGGGEGHGHRKGWLYDLCCWVTDTDQRLVGLPVIIESEWKPWSEVLDDFEKLLQARAGLRVLVFQHDRTTPENWADELFARVKRFSQSEADDAWLFAYWRDRQFHYRSSLWE